MTWSFYYAKQGTRFGPLPEGEVRRLVESGSLRTDDLIWTEGMPSWVSVGASELAEHLPASFDLTTGVRANGIPPESGARMPAGAVIAICLGCVVVLGVVAAALSQHRRNQEISVQPGTVSVDPQPLPSSAVVQEAVPPDPAARRLVEAQAGLLELQKRREEELEKERQEQLEQERKAARLLEEEQDEIRGTYTGLVNGQAGFVKVRPDDDGSIRVAEPFSGSTAHLSRNGRGSYSNGNVQCQFSNGTMTLLANGVSAIFVKN